MSKSRRSLLLVPAALLLAVLTTAPTAACPPDEVGSDASVTSGGPIVLEPEPGSVVHGLPTDSQAVGPGISVAEAMASQLDGPLLVNGILVATADGSIRLVDGNEATDASSGLLVQGLDVSGYEWTESDGAHVTGSVQVLGTVHGDTLVVSITSI